MKVSDIAFEEKSEYYENFDYFTDNKVVRVLLENIVDASLWGDAFPEIENVKFEFATAIDLADELNIVAAEGCKQLDKIGHYQLGKHLIICKDSDYKYLSFIMKKILNQPKESYFPSTYIFETNVHSKENLEYYYDFIAEHFARKLYIHPSSLIDKAPWLYTFYKSFSEILYKPLIKAVYHDCVLKESTGKYDELNELYNSLHLINRIPTRNLNDYHINFFKTAEWNTFKQKVNSFEVKLDLYFTSESKLVDIEKILLELHVYGINSENIYLFFKGHNIEKLFFAQLKNYLFKLYEKFKQDQISKLSGQAAEDKRRQLRNEKIDFNIKYDKRDLDRIDLFKSTIIKINSLYTA